MKHGVRGRARLLLRLCSASLPDLRLETGLDGVDGASRAAGLAGDEEDAVLLREEGVG